MDAQVKRPPKGYFEWENPNGVHPGPQGKGIVRFKDIQEVQVSNKRYEDDSYSKLIVWCGPGFKKTTHGIILEEQERFYQEYKAWLDYQDELEETRARANIVFVGS